MVAFKASLYFLTIAGMFFFAFWERKLKHQLTDDLLERRENVSDFDSFYGIREDMRRERILKCLPREVLFNLRVVVSLKFLFFVILIAEVIFLQR